MDEDERAGVPLVGEAPQQAGQEARASLTTDDVPGLVVKVRAIANARAGAQRDDPVDAGADGHQAQMDLQATVLCVRRCRPHSFAAGSHVHSLACHLVPT